MYGLARRLLFLLPPHAAHSFAMAALAPVEHVALLRGAVRAVVGAPDARLATRVLGLDFASPVGVAGGFDKNASRPRSLAALGFGFLELGTVTSRPQLENPRPNLFRLPADRALVNRLGFPNHGASRVAEQIARRGSIGVPVGVSIGKSRDVELDPLDGAIADYVASFDAVRSVADFIVVNVSSPNTKNLRAMQGADIARALFTALVARNTGAARKPLLVKISPDMSDADLEALLAVVEEQKLDGVVATNTTLARAGLSTDAATVEAIGAGGLSGPPVRARALDVVRRVRARLGPKVAVIGVGGIETSDDALAMLRAGADLVQLYTGFIYRGPLVARQIADGIARELTRTGAATVADLVHRDGSAPRSIGDQP
jgi:dihydroorotate dehydrogenase